jgi:hypothetical protein
MKTYRGAKVQFHAFLTSALDGGEWLASRPGHFTPGEKAPDTHWRRGLVGPRADLEGMEKKEIRDAAGNGNLIVQLLVYYAD